MASKVQIIGYEDWSKSEQDWAEQVTEMTINEIEMTALRIERDAKKIVPVDTGELRGSISTKINKSNESISTDTGTDVEYAEVVEFGGINQRSQPYLIPSFDKNTDDLIKTITNILKGV